MDQESSPDDQEQRLREEQVKMQWRMLCEVAEAEVKSLHRVESV